MKCYTIVNRTVAYKKRYEHGWNKSRFTLTDLRHHDSLHPVYNRPYVNFVYGIPILMIEDE